LTVLSQTGWWSWLVRRSINDSLDL
jgi:hypothetical protein